MSKRAHDSQASASASEDLVKRLKAAGNDVALLREILETNDSVSVAAALAALLTSPRNKARNRPCPSTPDETLVDILLFADRDALDAMQLACLFLRDFIRDREAKVLPLRFIRKVKIGTFNRPASLLRDDWNEHWLPASAVVGDWVTFDRSWGSVSQAVPYLRLAYCECFCIDLRLTRCVRPQLRGITYDAVFDDLVVPTTHIDVLKVLLDEGSENVAFRAFEKFKPVSKVALGANGYGDWESSPFDEAFFITAAEYGVRSISFDSGPRSRVEISLPAALAFGFAEPTTGGERSLTDQMYCELDGDNFLEQLVKKASELVGGQHIDFKFSIELLSEAIDPAGYEKYQKDDGSWLVNDLENGVNVEVKQIEGLVEIHVFSAV